MLLSELNEDFGMGVEAPLGADQRNSVWW